jgi:hypothetical protein
MANVLVLTRDDQTSRYGIPSRSFRFVRPAEEFSGHLPG